ncbi:hypothetical protein SAMD00019534_095410 [Acytostelium subglobosum LB1]|uniref:hypothetical protein n=1 Tax=Acytostelium subglobosum LB1 TaxID=1410327 RepID=UPI0006447FF3|nr:hypothetical protein SAMD00019534_095410 [Acytostelium subglobosum LB1]GAM26366.1 hypothetical protein SAMD00019534_095410 [Acytostelium subglobosum LB1]|eukprot:XP_012750920.1 hypothetical protein SAMD00019534_095410 [Acytostelium subglobosum LB1]
MERVRSNKSIDVDDDIPMPDEPVLAKHIASVDNVTNTATVAATTASARSIEELSELNMLHAFDDDTIIPLILAGYEIEDKLVNEKTLHRDQTPYTVDTRGLRLTSENKLIVPRVKKVIRKVISIHHDHWLGGHFDHKRTSEKIKRRYYWLTMNADILNYVQSCVICKLCSDHPPRTMGLLEPLAIPQYVFESITMDIIPKLSTHTTKTGIEYDGILLVSDRFSKFTWLKPLIKGAKSMDIIDLLQEMFCTFPRPSEIVTDNDPLFTAHVFVEYMKAKKVEIHMSLPYRHNPNGHSEIRVRLVKNVLRKMLLQRELLARYLHDDPTGILEEITTIFSWWCPQGPKGVSGADLTHQGSQKFIKGGSPPLDIVLYATFF